MTPESPLTSKIRLNKAIADSGLCSRRKAEEFILSGVVQVNGLVVQALATQVNPNQDKILVNGKPLLQLQPLYLLFNKPTNCLTSKKAQGKKETLYQYLPEEYQSVDPAGRLDYMSSGALILSNDGHFIHRVTHPGFQCQKIYRVTVNQKIADSDLNSLKIGIYFKQEKKTAIMKNIAFSEKTLLKTRIFYTYTMTLTTGYNRQIRRSLEILGYSVKSLHRIAIGDVELGSLPAGQSRPLSQAEYRGFLS